ncbi:hypothetical protein EMIHUDRAFT_244660, partial [Emiliania huxleyi CCMP1516]|uniref:AP2/ERF domain-containing protein n=2 Tax=Emiliania huxleyi TaxID=2903 RepID=A0A0D3J081_EMIH1
MVVVSVAGGVRLHLSSKSLTGYKGVHKVASGRFRAGYTCAPPDRPRGGGGKVGLGNFDTAVDAAVAYALAVGEYTPPPPPPAAAEPAEAPAAAEPTTQAPVTQAPVAAEAEGVRLHLSSSNSTGYKGVYKDGSRFKAQHRRGGVDGRSVSLGYYDTAVEAAVAYARSDSTGTDY